MGRWARTPRKGVEKVLFALRRDRGVGGGATINRNLPEVEGVRHERSRLWKEKIRPQDDLNKQGEGRGSDLPRCDGGNTGSLPKERRETTFPEVLPAHQGLEGMVRPPPPPGPPGPRQGRLKPGAEVWALPAGSPPEGPSAAAGVAGGSGPPPGSAAPPDPAP